MKQQNKDWTGNSKAIYSCHGASNHSEGERQSEDYYATDPKALELLLELEDFDKNVWECAAGEHHLANVLKDRGYNVRCSDIIDRTGNTEILDFLSSNETWDGSIISNPPYKFCREFCEKAIESVTTGNKVAMFVKLTFLEGQGRRDFFKKYPPKTIYVSSARLNCAKNGDFEQSGSSAVAYIWAIWERDWVGPTELKWFN